MSLSNKIKDSEDKHTARMANLEREIKVKRLFNNDDQNLKMCVSNLNQAIYQFGLDEDGKMHYAQARDVLRAAVKNMSS